MDSVKVNKASFARLMGVNKGTISKWIAAGRVEVVDGLIDVEAAKKRLAATENPSPQAQAQIARHAADKATLARNAIPADQVQIGLARKLETYNVQKATAAKANLELDQAARLLVERTEVDYVLADFGNTLRALLGGMADRLAPAIAAHRGDVAQIHAEIDGFAMDTLNEISDTLSRKMERI